MCYIWMWNIEFRQYFVHFGPNLLIGNCATKNTEPPIDLKMVSKEPERILANLLFYREFL